MVTREVKTKIGQLFVLGFDGRNVTAALKDLLTKYYVGGLVFFARNISEPLQAWELIRSLKSPDLIKAVDHEGGRVVRLPPPVTRFPPAAKLGEVNSPELAYSASLFQARELAAIGFNLNFAPVLDVLTNTANQVIGDRAFSGDPQVVARLGIEAMRGIHDAGMAACPKHFPGHGGTREDSHQELPRSRAGVDQLMSGELIPFSAAVAAGAKALMTAHVVYEPLDRFRPATLSRDVIEPLLRQRLKFKGVVVSDDMEMLAVAKEWDVEERTILAVKAGIDLLLFCHSADTQVRAIEALYRAVDGRIISESIIDQAYQRVQALKKSCRSARPASNQGELMSMLNSPEHKALADSLR